LDRFVEAVVKIDEHVGGPQTLPEFFPGKYFPRTFEQHSQQLQRLLRQPQLAAVPAQLACFQVELKQAKANHVLGR
jgi:hypothetical protein